MMLIIISAAQPAHEGATSDARAPTVALSGKPRRSLRLADGRRSLRRQCHDRRCARACGSAGAAARARIRLERGPDWRRAGDPHSPIRPHGSLLGRADRALRPQGHRRHRAVDHRNRAHSGPLYELAVAAVCYLGRHGRDRDRPHRRRLLRHRLDALVHRAARSCRRHPDGEQRHRPARLFAARGLVGGALRVCAPRSRRR